MKFNKELGRTKPEEVNLQLQFEYTLLIIRKEPNWSLIFQTWEYKMIYWQLGVRTRTHTHTQSCLHPALQEISENIPVCFTELQ